jgi:hypothetical protein
MRDEDVTFTIEDVEAPENALKQGGCVADVDVDEDKSAA